MSGASSIASPGGIESSATSCSDRASAAAPVERASPGRIRSSANQRASLAWWTSTGARVVGRITPGALTRRPTSELTSVDFPAPVDPPTTASSGASMVASRGST